MPLPDWLHENWFPLAQSLGIALGLVFNAQTLRRDIQARRTGDQILLTEQHRELWSEAHRRPELARLLVADRNIGEAPVTVAEEQFLLLVIVHFKSGWLLAREGSLTSLDALALDAGNFFRLPVPAEVWRRCRSTQEDHFRRFVEQSVLNGERAAPSSA